MFLHLQRGRKLRKWLSRSRDFSYPLEERRRSYRGTVSQYFAAAEINRGEESGENSTCSGVERLRKIRKRGPRRGDWRKGNFCLAAEEKRDGEVRRTKVMTRDLPSREEEVEEGGKR